MVAVCVPFTLHSTLKQCKLSVEIVLEQQTAAGGCCAWQLAGVNVWSRALLMSSESRAGGGNYERMWGRSIYVCFTWKAFRLVLFNPEAAFWWNDSLIRCDLFGQHICPASVPARQWREQSQKITLASWGNRKYVCSAVCGGREAHS